jgi:hypothetical protein
MPGPVTLTVVYDPELGVRFDAGRTPLLLVEVMLGSALDAVRRELLAQRLGAPPRGGAIVVPKVKLDHPGGN